MKKSRSGCVRILVAMSALLMFPRLLTAASVNMRDTLKVKVFYSRGNDRIDLSFRGNGVRLSEFLDSLASVCADQVSAVRSVEVTSSVSPEGRSDYNASLMSRRAESLRSWFYANSPERMAAAVVTGDFWGNLAGALAVSDDVPGSKAAIDVIRNTPEWISRGGKVVDGRKKRLMELGGGRTWKSMAVSVFPDLRFSEIIVMLDRPDLSGSAADTASVAGDTALQVLRDTVFVRDTVFIDRGPAQGSRNGFGMALKTNMLYDALLLPNIGAEFHLGRGWSLGADWAYSWWSSDSRHLYWRMYGGSLVLRKYFGRASRERLLSGHHFGIYGQIYTYDLEFGNRGYLGGLPGRTLWDRMNWGAGVEYGYSLPVTARLNIDFGLSLGYQDGQYMEYVPSGDRYVWQKTVRSRWAGPTRAEISLVWLLGKTGSEKSKGGE